MAVLTVVWTAAKLELLKVYKEVGNLVLLITVQLGYETVELKVG